MNILAVSDLHRDVEKTKAIVSASSQADIVACAGDFATKGEGIHDTLDLLKKIQCPVVLVSGNHDNYEELKTICDQWENAHLLHGSGVVLNGVSFYGLGCAIPNRGDAIWNETLDEKTAGKMLEACPENTVLVTHSPPHNCADLQRDGSHQGSEAIAACIKNTKPMLNLCGHIHFSWGASGTLDKTPVHNLGPTVNWFEV